MTEAVKRKKYEPLVDSATDPQFVVAGFTTLGESSPGALRLQEALCAAMKRKLIREGPTADGESASQKVATFRAGLREDTMAATRNGLAAQLTRGGQPFMRAAAGSQPPRPPRHPRPN